MLRAWQAVWYGDGRRDLTTDDDLAVNLLDNEIADSPVSQLANLGFLLAIVARLKGRVEAVDDHGVTLQVGT